MFVLKMYVQIMSLSVLLCNVCVCYVYILKMSKKIKVKIFFFSEVNADSCHFQQYFNFNLKFSVYNVLLIIVCPFFCHYFVCFSSDYIFGIFNLDSILVQLNVNKIYYEEFWLRIFNLCLVELHLLRRL
jgi:hypothetical protein